MKDRDYRRPSNAYSDSRRNTPYRERRAYREDPYIRDLNDYYEDSFEDRYEESDHNIYEDEFEPSREFRSYPRRNNNSGYRNVRGLRNQGPYNGPNDQGYEQEEIDDEDYDYSYDPYYRDDEGDYEYANEYTNGRRHAPVDEYEDEKWDYAPGSRSYRSGLNKRVHSDLYNGLMGGYDY